MNNSISKNSISVIIPFFNEEKTIRLVAERSIKYAGEVICVNDGSTDNSVERIKELPVTILNHKRNMGKGKALRAGFEYILKTKAEIVITIDADLQHNPDDIPEFISKCKEYDVVIGSRLNDLSAMPKLRILSNKITSGLLSLKTGRKILDSQCGFRAYRREVLPRLLNSINGFEAESMHLISAGRNGAEFGFVNIPTIYGDDSSKMRNFEAVVGFVKVMFM